MVAETPADPGAKEGKRARRQRAGARRLAASEAAGPGKWRRVRSPSAPLTDEQRALMAELEAIGYADGTREISGERVITVHDASRAQPGLNLWTSGHGAEAFLSTMAGEVVHRWAKPYAEVWEDEPVRPGAKGVNHFRRVHLDEGGGLFAIFEGRGILALDRDSNLLWANQNGAHHDMEPLGEGRVAVLTRSSRMMPELSEKRPILEDRISILASDGSTERELSLIEAFERSPFKELWRANRASPAGDLFHTNSLELLDGSAAHPAFSAGRWLVSMREISILAVVDMSLGEVVWAHQGAFRAQHDATIVPGGNLLIFDNGGAGRRLSRVVELDLRDDGRESWLVAGSPTFPLWSATLGTAQRLPNRNTLITESDGGRAVEVTPEGEVVWEMYNPHRAGEDGSYIAALFEVKRIDPAEVPWLE